MFKCCDSSTVLGVYSRCYCKLPHVFAWVYINVALNILCLKRFTLFTYFDQKRNRILLVCFVLYNWNKHLETFVLVLFNALLHYVSDHAAFILFFAVSLCTFIHSIIEVSLNIEPLFLWFQTTSPLKPHPERMPGKSTVSYCILEIKFISLSRVNLLDLFLCSFSSFRVFFIQVNRLSVEYISQ